MKIRHRFLNIGPVFAILLLVLMSSGCSAENARAKKSDKQVSQTDSLDNKEIPKDQSSDRPTRDNPVEKASKKSIKAAPERFVLTDINGKTRTWSEFAGKALIVNFWATWCGPCRMEMPVLKNIYNEFHSQGLEILGISVDRDQRKVPPFIKQMNIPWVILFADQNVPLEFKMGRGIPSTIIFNAEGVEVSRFSGVRPEGFIRQELKKAMAP